MTDKNLKKKLNIYADSLERKEEILYGAYHAMDLKRNSGAYVKKKKPTKWRLGLAAGIAATVVFVVLIGIILNSLLQSFDTNPPANQYSLDSLKKQAVSQEDFYNIMDVMFLPEEAGQTNSRYFIYVNEEKEIYAAKAIYRIIRDSGVDEITIISDLKNNLTDYKENKPYNNNSVVRYLDVYKNGEYYSYLATMTNNTTYYITITSPLKNAGTYYENILL